MVNRDLRTMKNPNDFFLITAYTLFFMSQSQSIFPLLAPLGLALFLAFRYLYNQNGVFNIKKNVHLSIYVFALYTFIFFLYSLVQSRGQLATHFIDYVSSDGRIFYFAVLLLFFSYIKYRDEEIRFVLAGHIIANVIILGLTAISYFKHITLGDFTIGVISQGEFRYLHGLLQDPNPYAAQLGAALISTVLYGVLFRKKGRLELSINLIIGSTFLIALMFCISRGFVFGLVISMLWLFFMSHEGRQLINLPTKFVLFLFIALLPLAYVSLFPTELSGLKDRTDTSLLRRTFIIKETIEKFSHSPLFGLGIGGHREFATSYETVIPYVLSLRVSGERLNQIIYKGNKVYGQHAHNIFLFLLTDFGIVGTGIILGFFGFYFHHSSSGSEDMGLATLHLKTGLVYLLASGMFATFTLTSTPVSTVFYISIAYTAQRLHGFRAPNTRAALHA